VVGVIRVPPPLIALSAGVAQRLLTPAARAPTTPRAVTAATVALAATWMAGAATARFRHSGTTLEPFHPDRASALVTTGSNTISRNPMYVGMAGLLLANAVRRGSWVALAPVAGFVVVIDRLQITLEEVALRHTFGAEYDAYCAAVPRWLDLRSLAVLKR
jgi:protein-S-isoprenylcysteine O-methyltransferase Ste14